MVKRSSTHLLVVLYGAARDAVVLIRGPLEIPGQEFNLGRDEDNTLSMSRTFFHSHPSMLSMAQSICQS